MAVELVLLSDTAPTREDWTAAARTVIGGGDLYELVDGSYLMRDNNNDGVLTWWPSRQLAAVREATQLAEGVRLWQVWTDVALPYVAPQPGRTICVEVARRLGGRVEERK